MNKPRKQKVKKREQWLYKNTEALKSVQTGLEQARLGQLVKGTDEDEDTEVLKDFEEYM